MRALIVKYFALSWRVQFFGRQRAWLRAANIIFPLMCLLALAVYFDSFVAKCIVFALLIPSLYFGFVYFYQYPVKWEELDDEQKWFYGAYLTKFDKKNELAMQKWKEWHRINRQEYNNKKRIVMALQNPVIGIITALMVLFF